jgi:hypothetical protein
MGTRCDPKQPVARVVVRKDGLRVSHPSRWGNFSVDFEFDGDGRIGAVSAMDRPRPESGRFVECEWRGRFSDYRLHADRWIPFAGEVGWVVDGAFATVWRGAITTWRLCPLREIV